MTMQIQSRILCIDYGTKNIGIAISDPFGMIAQPHEVITRADENSLKQSIERIAEITNQFDIKTIVVGYPKNMNNSIGDKCKKTDAFCNKLKKSISAELVMWDERLTSVQANYTLIEADMSRGKRKKIVDKVAAVFILQSYLDFNNKRGAQVKEFDEMEEFDEEELEVITLSDDDGSEFEFIVIDKAEYNGFNYVLVIENAEDDDDEEEEPDAFIFKEVIKDEVKTYAELNDNEFENLSKIFEDLSEDYDLK